MTHPMSSMSGYINYVKYVAGSNKGNIEQGYVFNDPFRLGKVDPQYTSSRVTKDYKLDASTTNFTADWKPVIAGTVTITAGDVSYVDDGVVKADGTATLIKVEPGYTVSRRTVMVQPVDGEARLEGVESRVEVIVKDTSGAVVTTSAGSVNYTTGAISITGGVSGDVQVAYSYNNVNIPQNDIPLLSAKMEAMPLLAKPRRIAIYYSQIAAFQAKTDYGLDLGDQLAEKAVGQLAYEIDTEVTQLLIDVAEKDAELTWSKTLPVGVSKAQHYEGFAELIEIAKAKVYKKTQRFVPNFMLCSATVIPVLTFIEGYKAANVTKMNGPYLAGELNGLKIYVTPNIEDGAFAIGVNAGDFNCSVAVYAPYMPIVPTQLLGHADGSMSQGFSTLYDLKVLNKDLIVAGKVVA